MNICPLVSVHEKNRRNHLAETFFFQRDSYFRKDLVILAELQPYLFEVLTHRALVGCITISRKYIVIVSCLSMQLATHA